MSVQFAEGDLYIGYSGSAITAATGTSGVACGSVLARQVALVVPHAVAKFRRGLKADDIVAFNQPMPHDMRIIIEPRDDSYSDALREVLRQAFGNTTGGRSDYSSGDLPGKFSRTVQLIVRPITGSLSVCLYAPAVVLDGNIELLWSRRGTHSSRTIIEFQPQRSSATATTPAMMWDTPANIQSTFFA